MNCDFRGGDDLVKTLRNPQEPSGHHPRSDEEEEESSSTTTTTTWNDPMSDLTLSLSLTFMYFYIYIYDERM